MGQDSQFRIIKKYLRPNEWPVQAALNFFVNEKDKSFELYIYPCSAVVHEREEL